MIGPTYLVSLLPPLLPTSTSPSVYSPSRVHDVSRGSPLPPPPCPAFSLSSLNFPHAPPHSLWFSYLRLLELLLGNGKTVPTPGLLPAPILMPRILFGYPHHQCPSSLPNVATSAIFFLIILFPFAMTVPAFSVHSNYFIFLCSTYHSPTFHIFNSFCLPWPGCSMKAVVLPVFVIDLYTRSRTVPIT